MSEGTAMDIVLRRLLSYRRGKGLSQTEFAKILGTSQTNYSEVERGMNIMSYRLLRGFYQYDYDIDFLFTGERTNPTNRILEEMLAACTDSMAVRLYNLMLTGFMELWEEEDTIWNHCLFSELHAMKLLLMKKGDMNSKLHYIRVYHDMSQKDFGNAMGVGRTKCGECEYGKKNMDADMLLRLYNGGYALPSFFFEKFAGIMGISVLLEEDKEMKRRFYRYLENVVLNILEDETLLHIIRTAGVL